MGIRRNRIEARLMLRPGNYPMLSGTLSAQHFAIHNSYWLMRGAGLRRTTGAIKLAVRRGPRVIGGV